MGGLPFGFQAKQFPITVPFQEAIETLHEAVALGGIVPGDASDYCSRSAIHNLISACRVTPRCRA